MAKERSAIATIKGYYYQFDYFILQLLKCNNETDSICIEGIEDVDLKTVFGINSPVNNIRIVEIID